ncbi:MAG TPA: pitrilysin family protein [Phycisphaerales bacterium]|nr:pitrilysin family protein [Phycisphaerales bacterium]
MTRTFKPAAAFVLAGVSLTGALFAESSTTLPKRPEEIKFDTLRFEPPNAADYRHKLSSGVTVYMIQSKEFPLISVNLSFKGGAYLEPADKVGLASMTGAMMRRGGTVTIKAQDMDEQFDFLAARASAFCGSTTSGASINSLASNFDQSFALFMDMVRNPGFQEDKVKIYRDEQLEAMKQRNDDANTIMARESRALVWGRDHFEARVPTKATLDAITIDDMKAFHHRIFNPGNMIVGVVGDFDEKQMLNKLETAFSGWAATGETIPDPADTDFKPTPGLFHVEKDIPQGKIAIGKRALKRDDPDQIKVEVMNEILGGGGFTARLMKRIRSDEGLTYGVGSGFGNRVYYPGTFSVTTFSKNRTVALTTRMVFEEINKMINEAATEQELDTAKNALIETFPRTFENKNAVVGVFIDDQWTKRDPNYWKTYRDNVRKVTLADVQEMAKKYCNPDQLGVLVVGKWSEICNGDPTEQRETHKASMDDIKGGKVTHLPLRDPLTMEPMPEQTKTDAAPAGASH